MRRTQDPQFRFKQLDLEQVELDLNCRHEMTPILAALIEIHLNHRKALNRILSWIESDVLGTKKKGRGCPGMDYWEILVLASVRLGCNLDYDQLTDLANNHHALRLVMGVDGWGSEEDRFRRSTIHQNLVKLKTETVEAIRDEIARIGHTLLPKAIESVRGDGFVVETNIHYPTDTSLMVDGLRVMLRLVSRMCERLDLPGWRQHNHLLNRGRSVLRKIQKAGRAKKKDRLRCLYSDLLDHLRSIQERVLRSVRQAEAQLDSLDYITRLEIEQYIAELNAFLLATEHVCQLAYRRVFLEEKIPNSEKIFSLFEIHTQLINRGKSPLPYEFGRHVFIVEDKAGFILTSRILEPGQVEMDIVVPTMQDLQLQYENKIRSASFDKGSSSKNNLRDLREILDVACVPRKGRRTQEDIAFESDDAFRKARRRHPGIESAIHALVDGNGLDRCRDTTELGFRRYVALATLGRNLHSLGKIVLRRLKKRRNAQQAQLN